MGRTTFSAFVKQTAVVAVAAGLLLLPSVAAMAQPSGKESDPPKADTKAKADATATKAAATAEKAVPAAAAAQVKSPAATAPKAPAKAPSKPVAVTRWVDFQAGNLQMRYRYTETSAQKVATSQAQDWINFKGRFKFDKKAKYSVTALAQSGTSFTGSWNSTGWGSGTAAHDYQIRQMYFSAAPVKGFEASFGSIAPWRGESTEITTWDNDGYLAGERLSVKRPKNLYFDEVGFTTAYFGDLTKPDFFQRSNRLLDARNFYQYFASKKVNKYLSASGDYTSQAGARFVHAGVTVKAPMVVLDSVKYEQYVRYGTKGGSGFGIYGEKNVTKKFAAGVGYGTVDKYFVTVNADRFGRGSRVYESFTYKLYPEFSIYLWAGQGVGNDFAISNKYRFDLGVNYNVLGSFQRAGYFK
jgi:hypothetical protein